MRRIDELCLKYPFYGARQMVRHQRREGVRIGGRRAGRLLRLMGLQAIYRAPRTSDPHPEHRVYPLSAQRLDDRAGEPCLVRRHHLHPGAARLSLPGGDHGLGQPACAGLASVEHPGCGLLHRRARRGAGPPWPTPEIFNTDQGSQFTGFAFTGRLREAGIRISMDGRGRCLDNIFIERLWRSLKYEAVYLRELADGFEARRVIGEWIDCYNTDRPHSALGGKTPAEAYRRRPVCGYDGPAATRLAHLPTGATTTARRSIQRDSGSRNDNRNTPSLNRQTVRKDGATSATPIRGAKKAPVPLLPEGL